MKLNKRAFALVSGGLDSMVAVKLVQEQGIEVIGVHFESLFYQPRDRRERADPVKRAAEALNIELLTFPKDIEFLHMIQNPQYGYGSAINPCIDCRIYYLKKIKPLMEQYNVSFVITGEVLGQRPKSQMRDGLHIVERDSGLKGYLVRPLCAQHLEPSMPEQEGVIDRNKLLKIAGRGRKEQMAIAQRYGLTEYPNPAGGCQFTEKEFVAKVTDLFTYGYKDNYDITILTCGRHFRINEKTKVIVTRNEDEGEFVLSNAHNDEVFVLPYDFSGPIVLIKGEANDNVLKIAAGLLQFHSKKREEDDVCVEVIKGTNNDAKEIIKSIVLNEDEVENYRLSSKLKVTK
ncbi:7-cyano-7-deazaguanine synthase [Candidatus Omnitrophota bacterium]